MEYRKVAEREKQREKERKREREMEKNRCPKDFRKYSSPINHYLIFRYVAV